MGDIVRPTADEVHAETKIIYYMYDEEEKTPYLIKLPVPSDRVNLGDFKNALNRPNCKFFFRSSDADFGEVKEEISDENARLPCFKGRVVAWLVQGDNNSDTTIQNTNSVLGSATKTPLADGRPSSHYGREMDQSACTSETESIVSGLPKFPRPSYGRMPDRRYRPQLPKQRQQPFANGRYSQATSELETTTFYESEDDRMSRMSTSTDITSVSQMIAKRRRRRRHKAPMSRASSVTSITESSMSLNVITVVLNMDTVNFLGISIVGHSNTGGDGGIYVGSIMKGGAVALDGRIEPGDMILQVNEVSFENMSNDDAVRVLRDAVQRPGPIKLVVAKNWDTDPRSYFTVPRTEMIRPIDPAAWVAHTNAMRSDMFLADFARPPSAGTTSFVGSNSETLTLAQTDSAPPTAGPDAERFIELDKNKHETAIIVREMARPDSGLDVHDRIWLKISIPNAFVGSDVVKWLLDHVQGFADRREARKYASQMLKEGYIKHVVNKSSFSEQCYYVFADLCGNMTTMKLANSGARMKSDDEFSQSDCGSGSLSQPLLPPPPTFYPSPPTPQPFCAPYPPSFASSYNPLPLIPRNAPNVSVVPMLSQQRSIGSNGSDCASGDEAHKPTPLSRPAPPPVPPRQPATNATQQQPSGGSTPGQPHRTLHAVPQDLSRSNHSFAMAMANPIEHHFVDVM